MQYTNWSNCSNSKCCRTKFCKNWTAECRGMRTKDEHDYSSQPPIKVHRVSRSCCSHLSWSPELLVRCSGLKVVQLLPVTLLAPLTNEDPEPWARLWIMVCASSASSTTSRISCSCWSLALLLESSEEQQEYVLRCFGACRRCGAEPPDTQCSDEVDQTHCSCRTPDI